MPRSVRRYRDLVAIGASAGGAQALSQFVADLPAELPAAVVVSQHTSPQAPAALADILARAGKLPATFAVNGEPIERGHIYVAPPDHHLLVGGDHRNPVLLAISAAGSRPPSDSEPKEVFPEWQR
jgi:chemotaxis response regulator CheB